MCVCIVAYGSSSLNRDGTWAPCIGSSCLRHRTTSGVPQVISFHYTNLELSGYPSEHIESVFT